MNETSPVGIGLPRFDSKISVELLVPDLGPCWLWHGTITREGYGEIRMGGRAGRTRKAHLVTYEELVGERTAGMQLDHLCHTADKDCAGGRACIHRACCNPAHLEPVTPKENSVRSRNMGSKRTHCPRGHAYVHGNIYLSTAGAQVCRICTLEKCTARRRATGAKPQKLTPSQRHEILTAVQCGNESKSAIARRYGVSPSYVSQLSKRNLQ